jgi:hypothetical protein
MANKSAQAKKEGKKRAAENRAAASAKLRAMASGTKAADVDDEREVVEEKALGAAGAEFDALVEARLAFDRPAEAAPVEAASPEKQAAQLAAADPNAVSNRQHKLQTRITVEALKLQASRPELIELHDANAPEPVFLAHLKCLRNTIAVPRHWCVKSLYLGNQVDREEPEGLVPAFVEKTGVAAMRPDNAKVDPAALARPFLAGHPKMPLTPFGDVFYEGKDMRARFRRLKPGVISDRLRQALGMTMNAPPPWLYGQQALAKLPPSYTTLKVAGLNAPLPAGARWGKSRGEWGEPCRKPDNSLVFPAVMTGMGARGAANDGEEVPVWGELDDSMSLCFEGRAAPAPAAPAPAAAPVAPAAVPIAVPAFVPAAHMTAQFQAMAPGQQVWAAEMQRVDTGLAAPGLMPTSQVFVARQGQPGADQSAIHRL